MFYKVLNIWSESFSNMKICMAAAGPGVWDERWDLLETVQGTGSHIYCDVTNTVGKELGANYPKYHPSLLVEKTNLCAPNNPHKEWINVSIM